MRRQQKTRTRKFLAFLAAVALLTLTGCGAASGNSAAEGAVSAQSADSRSSFGNEMAAQDISVTGETMGEAGSNAGLGDNGQIQAYQGERKLIRRVNMDLETKEFDQVISSLENEVSALGGYIESMNTYNGSSYTSHRETRYADMTVRVPQELLDGFLETVSGLSNVTWRSDNVEDVTLEYVDMESRRNALVTEQDRLLELLEQAQTVEDIITIESRLSEVRYEIESMESQLRTYDNLVDYSTVYLNISEVEIFTPTQEESIWERISGGFMDSLENIGKGFQEFFVGFLINLPYLLVAGIFAAAVIVIVLKCSKKQTVTREGTKKRGTEEKK